MERPCPQLPPPPRLLPIPHALLPTGSNHYHVPRQLDCPRTGNGLHHQKTTRLWTWGHDAPVAYRGCSEVEVLPRQDYSKRMFVFLFSQLN